MKKKKKEKKKKKKKKKKIKGKIKKKKKNDENKLTMCIAFATIFTIHYTEGQKGRANEKESV